MSDPSPPVSLAKRLRLDPAALPIAVAGLVMIGAVAWLLGRPQPPAAPQDDRLAQEIAALRAGLPQQAALEQRVAALEAGGARLVAMEGLGPRIAALETRQPPDLGSLREQATEAERRAAMLEERLAAVERIAREAAARPALDPAALANRAALEALTLRLDRLSDRAEASIRQDEARSAANAARIEALARDMTGRAGALEQAQGQVQQRLGATESTIAARIAALEQAQGLAAQRLAAAESALPARIAALDQTLTARAAAAEAQAARIAALEGTAQRLAALEGRAGRLATVDALRSALEAGRPLGGALAALRDPPEPLARFASTAPPTEAALRLSFEEAARAARGASEPTRDGQGVLDSAVSRLSGLLTVRRGEEVLWGDAAAAEIERARRALEAGDLEGALARLARLSPPAREAMRGWTAPAEALVAARAALRSLAAG
jgi:hypothetical protein